MKRRLDEKQKMYNTVLKFFDTEFPPAGKLPEVLTVSVEELRAAAGSFHENAVTERVSRKGATSDKMQNRVLVCKEGALLSRMLRAIARKTGNAGLQQNSRFTSSVLKSFKESELQYQALEIYKLAVTHQEELAKLGVTSAMMDAIESHIRVFGEQIVKTRMWAVESSGRTKAMNEIHGDASMILGNQINPLMEF